MKKRRDRNPWNMLSDEMVETVLALLPTLDFYRCQFVCKRWSSIINSPTFETASHEIFNRRPWFLIFNKLPASVLVYDMEICDWRTRLKLLLPTQIRKKPCIPVVSSGGLMCFQSVANSYVVCNPFTGSVRSLPRFRLSKKFRGGWIAMHVPQGSNSYKLFLVCGTWPDMVMKVFSPGEKRAMWKSLSLKLLTKEHEPWSIWDRGVTVIGNEQQILLYYLTLDGNLVCIDTEKCTIAIYSRLLEGDNFFTMDLVECGGRVFVAVLMETGGMSSSMKRMLHVWEFDIESAAWKQTSVLPANLSKDYYNNEALITCSGHGEYIMICVNSIIEDTSFNHVVIYNLKENTWTDLSPCSGDFTGDVKVLLPYSFKPDIKARV
ncbi:hypothetical protein MKW94_000088 [Papaver nudicaule]|uniref:F-box domain-containing protein n=1 Tax=Papaver nudicaule TaxID=74823 RepID=A0AA41VEV1_PAPNU|nr:hypothetical protein [Papaver nudicaule]